MNQPHPARCPCATALGRKSAARSIDCPHGASMVRTSASSADDELRSTRRATPNGNAPTNAIDGFARRKTFVAQFDRVEVGLGQAIRCGRFPCACQFFGFS